MTDLVRICDVSPRDGLQNEPGVITTADKIRLIDMLLDCGLAEIEATSFVSPKWVPQLGDAAEVLAGVRQLLQKRLGRAPLLSALVPNETGFERALEVHRSGLPLKIALFTAASETFNRKNINASIAESIERFRPIVPRALDAGMPIRFYISCAIACPFEGPIAPAKVRAVVDDVLTIFPANARTNVDIDLGDTIGVAHPTDIAALLSVFSPAELRQITIHLHDTYGRAADCVRAALHAGVRSFDGSAGGLGGCPYATSAAGKRAPGNIATELLVDTIEREGFTTGVDRECLEDAGGFAVRLRNRPLPSQEQENRASPERKRGGTDHIHVERHRVGEAGVQSPFGEIILDRPDRRNALTPPMLDALVEAINELANDDAVRAICIRGEGKTFCSGFDLDVCRADAEALPALLKGLSAAVRAMRAAPKAVVIGVQGAAVAGGCALLGGADFVIADEAAKFGYPVVLLGISPAVSAPTLRGMTAGGSARTRLLDPQLVDAHEARRIGLVHQVVHLPEDVRPRAQIRAQEFAAKPPHALARTKAWLNEISSDEVDAWLDAAMKTSLGLVGGEEEKRLMGQAAKK